MNNIAYRILLWTSCLMVSPSVFANEPAVAIPVLTVAEPDAEGRPTAPQPLIPAIIRLLAGESGLNLVVTPLPWRRAEALAENGDGLLYGAATTPERMRHFLFSKPIGRVNQWLVSTERAPLAFNQWADLRGKKIATLGGAKYSAEFEKRRGRLFAVEEGAATMNSRMMMLRVGRVDAVMVSSYLGASELETKLNCLFAGESRLVIAGVPVDSEPMMIAVPRSGRFSSTLPVLNRAIEKLVDAGAIQALSRPNVEGCATVSKKHDQGLQGADANVPALSLTFRKKHSFTVR